MIIQNMVIGGRNYHVINIPITQYMVVTILIIT